MKDQRGEIWHLTSGEIFWVIMFQNPNGSYVCMAWQAMGRVWTFHSNVRGLNQETDNLKVYQEGGIELPTYP